MSRDLINLTTVAKMVGVSLRTVKTYRKQGKLPLPVVQLSRRHLRWSRAEIKSWLASGGAKA